MRAPVTPLGRKLPVIAMAMLLALTLTYPASAEEAEGTSDAPMPASLMANGAGHVSAAVALGDDPEPVVGSFTVDGLTYVILDDARVMLVSVNPSAMLVAGADGSSGVEGATRGIGSGWTTSPQPQLAPSTGASGSNDDSQGAPVEASLTRIAAGAAANVFAGNGISETIENATLATALAQPGAAEAPSDEVVPAVALDAMAQGDDEDGKVAGLAALALPKSVGCDGISYVVAAIGPRAFVGCDADAVVIPAAVESVDEAAFRASSVASVEVAEGNPNLSSYDGVLYDAELTSLLLIPEGKQGAVRIPENTESVPPSAFSHCALVTSVSVGAGSAAFSSRNGLLYDKDGTTLLRVPAGATGVEIADGCTTVAASALEGCSQLRVIQAPASVVEVSPDVLGASAPEGLAASDPDASPVAGGPVGLSDAQGAPDAVGILADDASDAGSADAAEAYGSDGDVDADAASSPSDGRDASDASAPATSAPEGGTAPADARAGQLSSLVALSSMDADASSGMPGVDPAGVAVRLPSGADPAPWEALGFAVELAKSEGPSVPGGEPMGDLLGEGEASLGVDAPASDEASDDPEAAGEVEVEYGYANERSMDSYERAIPKVVATLRLQPLLAEGLAAEPLGEGSLATASFLYEGCLYVVDPEGGAALVAVDPKRLAECVEDPTTLVLPDYVDDGQWAYPLTRIAKGALRGSGVERLWIPASATYLDYALEGCETLRYVEISEESPVYSSKGGCLYDKAGEVLWMMPEGVNLSTPHNTTTSQAEIRTEQPRTNNRQAVRTATYPTISGSFKLKDYIKVYIPDSHGAHFKFQTYYGGCSSKVDRCPRQHTSWTDFSADSPTMPDDYFWTSTCNIVAPQTTSLYWSFYLEQNTTSGSIQANVCYRGRAPGQGAPSDAAWDKGATSATLSTLELDPRPSGTWKTSSFAVLIPCRRITASPAGPQLSLNTWTNMNGSIYMMCDNAVPSTITWALNDNTGRAHTTTVGHGAPTTAPAPTRTGYACTGWYTAASGGSKRFDCGASTGAITKDETVYAHWQAKTYSVSLDASPGAGGTPSVTATFDAAMPSVTTPSRIGYNFDGYFDSAGKRYYNADGASAARWDKDANGVTLTARWTVRSYNVTLDVGPGEVAGADPALWPRGANGLYRRPFSIGTERFMLPSDASKPGYAAFDGWVGDGIVKPSKRVWVQPLEEADLHDRAYTGVFSGLIEYRASLDLAGGAFVEAPEGWTGSGEAWSRAFTVESKGFVLPTPARTGHRFLGWAAVAADGSLGSADLVASVPDGSIGDRAWQAVWEATSYTITWDYAGQTIDGAASTTSSQRYGEPLAFPARPSAADPARDHYAFVGWFDAPEGGEAVAPGSYLVEGDSAFYAHWEPVGYVVHLHLEGGSVERDGQALPLAPDGHLDLRYTVEDEVALPSLAEGAELRPVREGMAFQGWVACAADGTADAGAQPQPTVVLPVGSHGERHFKAAWSFALRFEVPTAVAFRYDLADEEEPVKRVEGPTMAFRSRSAGPLCVAGLALDASGGVADAIVADRRKVSLLCMAAGLPDDGSGWLPLPRTAAPELVAEADLARIGFGAANPVAAMGEVPLRYEIEVIDPLTTLRGELDGAPLAAYAFTVQGLW